MKKLLTALLALSVVGAVYAADPALKVSGYVNSGLKVVSDSSDTTVALYNDDYEGATGNVAFLQAVYSSDTAGFKIRMKAKHDGSSSTSAFSMDDAYAYGMPVAGLKIFAGVSYSDVFDGVDDDSNDYFNSKGASATYSISGLTLGAGLTATTTYAPVADTGYVLGAAYDLEKMLKVRFNASSAGSDLNKMSISAAYTGIENLMISGGYLSEGMATTANSWIDATVKYTAGPLFAQVVVYDMLDSEYISIAPRVGYAVTPALTVYGQVAYVTDAGTTSVDDSTIKPRAYMSYMFDKASKFYGQVEYNTYAETTTVLLQYVFSF